ncbi:MULTISPECIES: flagellar motor stator protein MotA [Clostridium]|uniref:Flagellar motor stator protein MotA n=1 Tax=Clostridium paridis TaxID=2803863 RepID=A0A937FJA6_9CLOT|nr:MULTISPECIES: flagellar motor stator protein MotA [Clostridium]MBL4933322.1 flagellar motor stator protein MotA [Clostridium paridis]
MDIFLLIGIVVGFFAVLTGLLLKGASVAILVNGEAVIVILVGTMAAVMNAYTSKEFLNMPKLFGALFSNKVKQDPIDIINLIINLAQETRRNGLLSLETKIQEMEAGFMKRGLEMVVDGVEPDICRQVLEGEIQALEERHRVGASMFTTAGGTSPTLGVLGAVIGLIGALGNLNDTQKLGESIASAFVATLYGIFFGYVIWHPFASRLKRKSTVEVSNMELMLEGILSIQEGINPKAIEQKLASMLSPKDRKRLEEGSSTTEN